MNVPEPDSDLVIAFIEQEMCGYNECTAPARFCIFDAEPDEPSPFPFYIACESHFREICKNVTEASE